MLFYSVQDNRRIHDSQDYFHAWFFPCFKNGSLLFLFCSRGLFSLNRLRSGSKVAERDIVQFVPFREFKNVSAQMLLYFISGFLV